MTRVTALPVLYQNILIYIYMPSNKTSAEKKKLAKLRKRKKGTYKRKTQSRNKTKRINQLTKKLFSKKKRIFDKKRIFKIGGILPKSRFKQRVINFVKDGKQSVPRIKIFSIDDVKSPNFNLYNNWRPTKRLNYYDAWVEADEEREEDNELVTQFAFVIFNSTPTKISIFVTMSGSDGYGHTSVYPVLGEYPGPPTIDLYTPEYKEYIENPRRRRTNESIDFIKYAGEIHFNSDGTLHYWNNKSGHMKPLVDEANNTDLPMDKWKDGVEHSLIDPW